MKEKLTASSSSTPRRLHTPRTPLQKAAVTINAVANSKYLTDFPDITPEDIVYADRIVKNLPSNIGPGAHTFAFAMSTPMSIASSPELTVYAALRNEVTAGAILKAWALINASRELETPTLVAKGASDGGKARELWDALERCWGKKIADGAWLDYVGCNRKEEGAGGAREGSAASGSSGDQGEMPWKRAISRPMSIGGAASMIGGSVIPHPMSIDRPASMSGGSPSPHSMSIDRAVSMSGGSAIPHLMPIDRPASTSGGSPSLQSIYIDRQVSMSTGSEAPREETRSREGFVLTPIRGAVSQNEGIESPGEEETRRHAATEPTLTPSATNPPPPPGERQSAHPPGQSFAARTLMRYPGFVRSRSHPETSGARPEADMSGTRHDI